MGKLDVSDPRPPYLQVADGLLGAVIAGTYPPGQQLPSLQALAEELDVAVGTVRRALGVLTDKGVITTRQGTGSFVRPGLDVAALEAPVSHDRGVHAELARLAERLDQLTERLAAVEQKLS